MDKDQQKSYTGMILSGISLGLMGYFEIKNWLDNKEFNDFKKNFIVPLDYDVKNEGKPVFVKGVLKNTSNKELEDPLLEIKQSSLYLKRTVEMFQFIKEKSGEFRQIWSEKPIPSDDFPDDKKNAEWKYQSEEYFMDAPYAVYPLFVGNEILKHINSTWTVKPIEHKVKFQKDLRKKGFAIYHDDEYYYLSRFDRKNKAYQPRFGDYRIKYTYNPEMVIMSIIGGQTGSQIAPYRGKVYMAKEGSFEPEEMIQKYETEHYTNMTFKRILYGFGLVSGLYFTYNS
ncbi:unnamed protein product [Blepharisma stoltei]|uniref:Uncharacterized protein n=1 Tax=Blepharisma stoltei TaxID=1481888 RepID=A0AAU9JDV2_9CILI|nr:unnamed protein product [Blepharisma stoltei]